MDFENLALRPSSGSIDSDAIATWLGTKDYAFLAPGTGIWHLSGTKKEMEESRRKYVANPNVEMPRGVLIGVHPDVIGMTPNRSPRAEGRAIEFLRWLVSKGDWEVQLDQDPWEPLGDPARLFPDAIAVTDEPDETDHTVEDLTEGVRHTWNAAQRRFIVHSSGQWRTELRDATPKQRVLEGWRGELSAPAMEEWKAAVASAGELIPYVDADVATGSFEVEDDVGMETAWFDASDIPGPLMPLDSLVERWVGEIARWNDASPNPDLLRVRRA